jgi:hypothetical protein
LIALIVTLLIVDLPKLATRTPFSSAAGGRTHIGEYA